MTRIDKIQVAAGFALDEDVVLNAGREAKSVQGRFGGKVQVLNVPPVAPPQAPRIIVRSENFLLSIGLSRYDIVVTVPNHVSAQPDKAVNFAGTVVGGLAGHLLHVKDSYKWAGVIANVEFPASNAVRSTLLTQPVFDRLINVPRDERELSAFQLQYGFQSGSYFRTYTISGYETLAFKVQKGQRPDKPVWVEREDADLQESGILVVVDVNNKPVQPRKDFGCDLSSLLDGLTSAMRSLAEDTNLRGIID